MEIKTLDRNPYGFGEGRSFKPLLTAIGFATLVAIPVILAWRLATSDESKKQEAEQRAVAEQLIPLIDACKSKPITGRFTVRGKILIWDLESNDVHPAQRELPSELREFTRDDDITVVIIVAKEYFETGMYQDTHQPAVLQVVDGCIFYWPSKELVGIRSFIGEPPARSRPRHEEPEIGELNKSLARQIEHPGDPPVLNDKKMTRWR